MRKYITLIAIILTIALANRATAQRGDRELYKLQYAWQVINSFYVDTINEDKMVEDAIIGMLDKLDPHSAYVNVKELKALNEPLEGSFDGIGIEFSILHDSLHVVNTIAGGPSEKVGLKSNDRIIKVDGKDITNIGIKNSDVFKLLRGQKGTRVTLDVRRPATAQVLNFTITRDKIPIYSVDASYMAAPNVGFIKINRFGAKTHDEFVEALKKLKKDGMKSLIIDLRGNGGGYLKAAFDIANEVIPEDRIIVYTKGNASPLMEFKSTGNGLFLDGQLVVLVDETSASASEILSGAIQDWDRGVIVGVRTFGKGLVQRPFGLPDGSEIRLTTAKYYTPSGRCIQKEYAEGNGKYQEEIWQRYTNGELVNQDSIKHNDSLMYTTLVNKRKVYGGGGIIPDAFVPIDTTKASNIHQQILRKGVLHKFAITLFENGTDKWKEYPDYATYKSKFVIDNDILSQLSAAAASDSINCTVEELQKESLLATQIKALIAQRIYGTSYFYETINPEIDSYKKAIEIICNRKQYNAILKGTSKQK